MIQRADRQEHDTVTLARRRAPQSSLVVMTTKNGDGSGLRRVDFRGRRPSR